MKTNYEYFVQRQHIPVEGIADSLSPTKNMGLLGWELCGVYPATDPGPSPRLLHVYKRALPAELVSEDSLSKMGTIEPIHFIGDGDDRISFVRGVLQKYKDTKVDRQEIIDYLSKLVGLEKVDETDDDLLDKEPAN